MKSTEQLILTPNQILVRVSVMMALGIIVIASLLMVTGDGGAGLDTDILAVES